MKHSTPLLVFVVPCLFMLTNCYKNSPKPDPEPDLINEAKSFVMSTLLEKQDNDERNTQAFTPSKRMLRWDKAKQEKSGNILSLYIPVQYAETRFISVNIDPRRLFNTNYLQQLRVWKDSLAVFHAELVTRFPDSNYVYGQKNFSGLVLVRDWQDHFIKEYKYEKNGGIGKRMDVQQYPVNNRAAHNNLDEICFYSWGYNYALQTRTEYYYWEIELGCFSYFYWGDGGGSGATNTYSSYTVEYDGGGGSSASNAANEPYVTNPTIVRGNNIIGNIKDYNKCFDNIAGGEHRYTVTVCVDQPLPYQRTPWGFDFHSGSGSTDFVSAGHTFLVLSDQRSGDKITRNVGFYPANGASPASPADQGQLNNDADHDYNIALTIDVTNSQFFTILEFVSHGNDAGYSYDLNSNNCSTFAINALVRAGIQLPVYTGYWPNGGGYDPGDLGEDIRNMQLPTGMTRSTVPTAHPNTGNCQ